MANLKIKDIETVLVDGGEFDWLLVKVHSDGDLVGIGECRGSPSYFTPGVEKAILATERLLIGEDPTDVNRLHQLVYRTTRAYGGVAAHAMSAIDIALWDLAGKILEVPIYRLLGGRFRDEIRIYCDCGVGVDGAYEPDAYAERAKIVKGLGFTALKFDVDLPEHQVPHRYNRGIRLNELKNMVNFVEAIRDEIGYDVDLAIDCHWSYNTGDAIRLATALEEFDLLWLEDPVPPENIEAMAEVSASTIVPICTGENLHTAYGFRDLIENQAVRIVAPDMAKVGGLSEGKRIADMADLYYINMAPHNTSSPIGTLAACHVCAAIPNFLALEFHAVDVPWWNDLVNKDTLIRDGYLKIPDKPGLGVGLNEREITKHIKGTS